MVWDLKPQCPVLSNWARSLTINLLDRFYSALAVLLSKQTTPWFPRRKSLSYKALNQLMQQKSAGISIVAPPCYSIIFKYRLEFSSWHLCATALFSLCHWACLSCNSLCLTICAGPFKQNFLELSRRSLASNAAALFPSPRELGFHIATSIASESVYSG